jgi:hypothetical protein
MVGCKNLATIVHCPIPLEPTAIARTLRPASRDQRKRQQASRSSNTITQIRSIDPAKGAALNRIGGACWADGEFTNGSHY